MYAWVILAAALSVEPATENIGPSTECVGLASRESGSGEYASSLGDKPPYEFRWTPPRAAEPREDHDCGLCSLSIIYDIADGRLAENRVRIAVGTMRGYDARSLSTTYRLQIDGKLLASAALAWTFDEDQARSYGSAVVELTEDQARTLASGRRLTISEADWPGADHYEISDRAGRQDLFEKAQSAYQRKTPYKIEFEHPEEWFAPRYFCRTYAAPEQLD